MCTQSKLIPEDISFVLISISYHNKPITSKLVHSKTVVPQSLYFNVCGFWPSVCGKQAYMPVEHELQCAANPALVCGISMSVLQLWF